MKQWLEIITITALVLVFSIAAHQRNRVWRDYASLWSDVVKKSPNKARGYNYLGIGYHEKGRFDEAIEQYKKAISIKPRYANAYCNMGISYFEKGNLDLAILNFKMAIGIKPDHADAHYNLGIALGEKGMMKQSYDEMQKGMQLRKKPF